MISRREADGAAKRLYCMCGGFLTFDQSDRRIMTGTPRVAPATVWGSMTRLRRIIELERATVIFHHDAAQWKTLRLLPELYD